MHGIHFFFCEVERQGIVNAWNTLFSVKLRDKAHYTENLPQHSWGKYVVCTLGQPHAVMPTSQRLLGQWKTPPAHKRPNMILGLS